MSVGRRRGTILAVALGLWLSASAGETTFAKRPDEYQLKAAILLNFAKFVEWPPDAFSDSGAPIVFCVLGVDPFGAALDVVLRGQSVGRHPAELRRIGDASARCHLMFVANSEMRRLPAVLDQLASRSVLIVGEAPDFAGHGGMIGLVTDSAHVQFELNLTALERGRLKMSSNVMALARAIVR